MPGGRFGGAAVALDGATTTTVCVFGGEAAETELLASVVLFDVRTETWSELETSGDVPSPRVGAGAVVVDTNTVVVFGGLADDGYKNDVYALDIRTGVWTEVGTGGALPDPRAYAVCVLWAPPQSPPALVVHGGRAARAAGVFGDLFVLDLASGLWRSVTTSGPSPGPRAGHVGLLAGSRLLIHGGLTSASGRSPVALVSAPAWVDLDTGAWTVFDDPDAAGVARAHAAAAAVDSTGYIFGGYTAADVVAGDLLTVSLPPPPLQTLGLSSLTASQSAALASGTAALPPPSPQTPTTPSAPSALLRIKCKYRNMMRIMTFDRNGSFSALQAQLDAHIGHAVDAYWKDETGDRIVIKNQDDLAICLSSLGPSATMLVLFLEAAATGVADMNASSPDVLVRTHSESFAAPRPGSSSADSPVAPDPRSHLNASTPAMGTAHTTAAMRMSQQGRPTYEQAKIVWQKGKLLGSGAFGKVYLGINSATGEIMAVKQIVLDNISESNQEELLEVEGEISILQNLWHKHIVRYIATERATNDDGQQVLNIFLEYVPGGSLTQLIHQFTSINEATTVQYIKQILEGLAYLHENGIVHRDIKCANILYTPGETTIIKLTDFGASKPLIESGTLSSAALHSFKGTPFFMAPEIVLQQPYGNKVDIWSVGCVVIELMTGKPPWSEFTPVTALFKLGKSNEKPKYPPAISPEGAAFLDLCFERHPDARPSAKDLLGHVWICRASSATPPSTAPPAGTPPAASSPSWGNVRSSTEWGAAASASAHSPAMGVPGAGMVTLAENPMMSVGGPRAGPGAATPPAAAPLAAVGGVSVGGPPAGGVSVGGPAVGGYMAVHHAPPPASSGPYSPGGYAAPFTPPTPTSVGASAGFAAGFAQAMKPGGVPAMQGGMQAGIGAYSMALAEPVELNADQFWAAYVGGSGTVMIDTFLAALQTYLGRLVSAAEQEYFKELMGRQMGQISLDAFKSMLHWFGPVRVVVERVAELMSQPWFHGYLGRDATLSALTNVQPGYFLVRISESTPGGYVVAYVATDGQIVQSKVFSDAQGFTADAGRSFYAGLVDLIAAYAAKLQYPRKRVAQTGYAQLGL